MNKVHECPHCGDRWVGGQQASCCAASLGEDALFSLTPKGLLYTIAVQHGLSDEVATQFWDELEAFCIGRIGDEFGYAALVFDGAGGDVIGLNAVISDSDGENNVR